MLSVQNVRQKYLGDPYTSCVVTNSTPGTKNDYDETECTYKVRRSMIVIISNKIQLENNQPN